ncbi:hypothetical protein CEP51_016021 [Fusarium floridanum]|uniref:Uncharacterized protein n=2 Tax=Fusarium solani species complex TaxID=232080 RepID=A0A428NYQ4_9HYPO|nr:hypothetical protein CEP51_016021 [Fusarium floridanum]RSL79049.1 hypothetical protein CDV31_017235 [Fusarium ambrosium]
MSAIDLASFTLYESVARFWLRMTPAQPHGSWMVSSMANLVVGDFAPRILAIDIHTRLDKRVDGYETAK